MSEQQGGSSKGKGKLQRSRAACFECHKVKQRCTASAPDTPCPCHRCVTWGIDCVFPPSSGKAPSSSASNRAPSPIAAKVKPAVNGAQQQQLQQTNAELTEQLRLMTSRLESIESTLGRAQISFPQNNSSSHNPHASSLSNTASDNSPHPHALANQGDYKHSGSNPVETAGEAMAVEGLVDLSGPLRGNPGGDLWDSLSKPDVLDKGIMTLTECESEFELFFRKIQPWTAFLSINCERKVLDVRTRSPLLFHSMLLVTLYFRPRTPTNLMLYRSVSNILDSILAPIILCPQTCDLSSDTVRALHLLLLYKPVQWTSLGIRGITDPSLVEHASKMNVRASWMLRGLVSRVSAFVGLPSITQTFATAFANQHLQPMSDDIVNEQRLYFGLLYHESHGAMQSGAKSCFIPQEALRTTRLFATLRKQSSDVRLSAQVELAAIVATIINVRKENDKVEPEDLKRFDEEMEGWAEHWIPILNGEGEDELAYTTEFPYAGFVRVVVNGFAFTRWKAEKKALLKENPMAPQHEWPTLSELDRNSILKAVQAAEGMLLALTIEGRAARGTGMSWSAAVGPTLTLDEDTVRRLRWASDSLTCVVYSYPLILLAKLANEGLLNSNLELMSPTSLLPGLPQTPLYPTDKLCRLLELGADFLDSVAPNPHHPSVRQALFLRRIREAGISGRKGIVSAPGSPRLGNNFSQNSATGASSMLQASASPSGFQQFVSSSSFNPTPAGTPPAPDDPFSALLSGVSPSMFDGSYKLDNSYDASIDWGMGFDFQ